MADKGSNMNHASVSPKDLPGMTPPLRLRKWEAGSFGYPTYIQKRMEEL